MNKNVRLLLYGFITWLIPFVVAFFFYSKDGQLLIDQLFFKSIMVVVGSLTGAFFLVMYFKKIDKDYLTEGVLVGFVWFFINIVFDLLTLVLFMNKPILTYADQIGFVYLAIPTMSIAMGYILSEKK